jgi:hypothetical protein
MLTLGLCDLHPPEPTVVTFFFALKPRMWLWTKSQIACTRSSALGCRQVSVIS